MIDLGDSAGRKWFGVGAVLLLLGIALTWAISRMAPSGPVTPEALLRRAAENYRGVPRLSEAKEIQVQGTSSSGGPVQAVVQQVRDSSGREGYGMRLREPLKEGETARLSMPGGGSVVIGTPREDRSGLPPSGAPKTDRR